MTIVDFFVVLFLLLCIFHRKSIAKCARSWIDLAVYMLNTSRKNKREIYEMRKEYDRIQDEILRIRECVAKEQEIIDRHLKDRQ